MVTHDYSEITPFHLTPERKEAARREAEARKVWALRDEWIDFEADCTKTANDTGGRWLGAGQTRTKIVKLAAIACQIESEGGWYCPRCETIRHDDEPSCSNCASREANDLHNTGEGA